MRLKLKAFLWMMAAGVVWIGCRKMDQGIGNQITMSANETNFFSDRKSDDPYVQSLADYVARNNSKYKFVDKVTRQIGYPYWDKAVRVESKPNAGGLSETNPDSVNITYIPFVRENENFVNASLIIKTTPTDTFFRYLQDWEYRNFNGDSTSMSWHADDVFKVFATLDRFVFNRTQFRIIDTSLFAPQVKDYILASGNNLSQADVVYNLEPSAGGQLSEVLAPFELCYSNSVCIAMSTTRNSLTETSLPSCPPGYGMVTFTECVIIMAEVETGGGGYGGTSGTGGAGSGSSGPILGGGSGSSGGGGWIPPPPNCTPPILAEDVTNPPPPCPPGWTPTGGGFPTVEPIDSLLFKAATLSNKYRDSLSAIAEADSVEIFFNIVSDTSNVYDTFRVIKSKSSEEVIPNYAIGNRNRKGDWHYHIKYNDSTYGSWPSGGDVVKIYDKPKGYVMIVDTYNARYALVVEDPTKMASFKMIMGNGPNTLPKRIWDAVLTDPRAYSSGSVYVDMTRDKLLSVLNPSSNCGIGLYVASSSHGTSFIKVN